MVNKFWFGVRILLIITLILIGSGMRKNAAAAWWDKFGEPKHGGKITLRSDTVSSNFDVTTLAHSSNLHYYWEELFIPNWTVDREEWAFNMGWTPDQYIQGCLAEAWEMTSPTTLTVHIRKGIHYTDQPPANGREFTAEDVQYHYDRMLGTGSGFTEPNPAFRGPYAFLKKVTATDRYTVVFECARPSALNFNNIATTVGNKIECRESVESGGGSITDWKIIAGTGPFILTGFVDGSQWSYSKNPDYWGHDERYPDNRLPYVDNIKVLHIVDTSTALAAMRTGKIDNIKTDWRQAKALEKSNPELQQFILPFAGQALQHRHDREPFNDIRVRKAFQMAMNLGDIALAHYGGTVKGIPNGPVSQSMEGFCYPYDEWPQSLKDEYSYNPEKAKQLLAEAGFPDGFKTKVVAAANADLALLEIMKSYLSDIGVDMTIDVMETVAWGNYIRAGKHDALSYSAWPMSGETLAPGFIIGTFEPGPRNADRFQDDYADKLIKEFYSASNVSQIGPIMRELDKVAIEKHAQVQTFTVNSYLLFQPHLKGLSGEVDTANWGVGWYWARIWVD